MQPTLPAHGVLLELNGVGLYLIGASGIGKSEIALQLINQGACLICDDAPDLRADRDSGQVSGHCPEGFYGQMHIHDLGIINITELINTDSFKPISVINFIIELVAADDRLTVVSQQTPQQLLTPDYQHWQYQHWTIPGIHLHLYPNRNIPLLIKTAVMQFLFLEQQQSEITNHQRSLRVR